MASKEQNETHRVLDAGIAADMVVKTAEATAEVNGEEKDPSCLAHRDLPLLATAIEQAAESIVITDTEARIQYVNPAFTRLTGYGAGEVIGQSTRILKSAQQNADYYRDLWETIAAGQIWHGELINRGKDG